MAAKLEIYKCEECGNIVEVINAADGTLQCCNQDMALMPEQTADPATQKHVPVVEKIENGMKVVVGSTPHPMTDEHYIQWIEVIGGGKAYRKFLNPGDAPEATFTCAEECCCEDEVVVREYCNQHGLWKA
ncbi:MAG: desulfoferrodoxin [Planctomycetota bacterium]|jgi:superoxide reductase